MLLLSLFGNLYKETAYNGYITYTNNTEDHSLTSYYVKDYSRNLFTCPILIHLILSAKPIDNAKREKKWLLCWLVLKFWRTYLKSGYFKDCVVLFHLGKILSLWLRVWWMSIYIYIYSLAKFMEKTFWIKFYSTSSYVPFPQAKIKFSAPEEEKR